MESNEVAAKDAALLALAYGYLTDLAAELRAAGEIALAKRVETFTSDHKALPRQ